MHCVSCEMILEKDLKNLPWVKLHMVSHKKWVLEVEYRKESDYKKVVGIIEKNWFKVFEQWNNENNLSKILLNIIAILIVIVLYIFSWLFDLNRFLPDTSTMSYSWAFLVWIIASVSTCLAITWWIIIWFARYIDSTHSTLWHVKVQLWFQIWRILWFFVLWGILWLTWKILSLSFSFNSILTFVVWILLLYMWLNLFWIFPSITKFWLHMPKSFASKIENLWKPEFAPIAWILTFFLPCGFTQSMQLLAISSWSFWWGGLVMLFFAIWTFPVLFSVWLWSSYFEWKKFPIFNKIIAAILIFFWITTISNSYNLLWINLPTNTQNTNNIETNVDLEFEEVSMWFDWFQTVPSTMTLEKWKNYRVTILPSENWRWCMTSQVIPKLSSKVSYVIKWKPIVYEIKDAKPGTYDIVCWSMWMSQWEIVVR